MAAVPRVAKGKGLFCCLLARVRAVLLWNQKCDCKIIKEGERWDAEMPPPQTSRGWALAHA